MLKKASSLIVGLLLCASVVHADIGVLATNNAYTGTAIKCDGTTDDAANMQTLITTLQALATSIGDNDYKNKSYITFPANATCKFNSGFTINGEQLGLAGDGTLFDFTGLVMSTTENFSIGTGDGATTFFHSSFSVATPPIVPGTLTITAGSVTGTDSASINSLGESLITGTGITSGTLPWPTLGASTASSLVSDYGGYMQVTYASPPAAAVPVNVAYTSYTPAITITGSGNAYGAHSTVFRGIHIKGPGQSSNSIGLLIQLPGLYLDHLLIHNVGIGVQHGANAYVDVYQSPTIYNAQMDMNLPSVSGGGENIMINQPQLFNSGSFINNGEEVAVFGGSFDFWSKTPFINGGNLKMVSPHIEGSRINNSDVFYTGGCNTFNGKLLVRDLEFLNDGATSPTQALVENNGYQGGGGCNGNGEGGYVRISDAFVNNLNASSLSCAAGSGPTDCLIGTSSTAPYAELLNKICGVTTNLGGGLVDSLPNVGICP